MIRAAVVTNGLGTVESGYRSSEALQFHLAPVSDPRWPEALAEADWIAVPNGSDHVALWRARAAVRRLLERGGALICGDGWFTDWVPGHRWIHDNAQPTSQTRYRVVSDRHGLLAGVDLEDFAVRDGIRGWWACGYIEPAPGADVLLEDAWGRPVLVLDERSTAGSLLLSASGPLAERYGAQGRGLSLFWERALAHLCATTPRRGAAARGEPLEHEADPLRVRGLATAAPGARIGLLFNGVWSHWAFATAPKYRPFYRLCYVHELAWEQIRDLSALVIPFQSDHAAIARHAELLDRFLAAGRTIAVFGSSRPEWLGARWEHRPVDGAWWLRDPTRPPIVDTDCTHPLYAQLEPRHAGWHCHGAYTALPDGARVIQRNREGEAVTWQVQRGGGTLFASTKDPIVEHGVQQIRHLDHYNDALTEWLCGSRPAGRFEIEPRFYGVALS